MSSGTMNRRDLLKGMGLGVVVIALPGWEGFAVAQEEAGGRPATAAGDGPEIKINNNYARGQWFFDPAGLYVPKGQKVRWLGTKWGATVTAFHPSNYNHELRIPEGAKPFDSGLIGEDSNRYNSFEWTFDVEGTYDYFSRNHEVLGMVGRIVVGSPGGPAEKNPPGYGGREGRAPVFPAQAKMLEALPSAQIVAKKIIPYPRDVVVRSFPYGDAR